MKKIKILRDSQFTTFEKEINKLLRKGWETKGKLIIDDNCHYMVFYKK